MTQLEAWELTFPKKRVLTKRGSKSSEPIEITLGKLKQNSPPATPISTCATKASLAIRTGSIF